MDLKVTYPDIFVEGDSLLFAKDHTGYWLKVNFYDEEGNKSVQTLIREADKGFTNLTLVSFIDKKTGHVRLMNRDFGFFDNRRQIKRFDDLIVKKLLENKHLRPHSMPITALSE